MERFPRPSKASKRLATEIRDTLLPDLVAMSMLLTTLRGRLDLSGDTQTHQLVHDMAQRLNTDIDDVRSLIGGLSGQ